jgi:thymidylate synthase (FAD)
MYENDTYGFTVELKTDRSTQNPDETAAMAARGDYMNDSLAGADFEKAMEETDKDLPALIEDLLYRGHFGPFEHPQAFFAVEGLSVVVERQITRHRHMSWDVQSMRYVDFDEAAATLPDMNPDENEADLHYSAETTFDSHYKAAFDAYDHLVEEKGVEPQKARYVLPLGTKVNLSFSANARSLMHFLDLRDNAKAQPEAQAFAKAVVSEAMDWSPLTFSAYKDVLNNNSLRAP